VEHRARLICLRRFARRVTSLTVEIDDAHHEIRDLVADLRPDLLDKVGIGPLTAAQVLISWPTQDGYETSAFAALAGVSPLNASSGTHQRHRLNRHGDRALNQALHTIAVTRERCDPTTKAYVQRRVSEGKTRREARRLVKRYIAHQLYRQLEHWRYLRRDRRLTHIGAS